jgi:hypothetical protein
MTVPFPSGKRANSTSWAQLLQFIFIILIILVFYFQENQRARRQHEVEDKRLKNALLILCHGQEVKG